jgi:nucleosome assembly protein 1-like 1
MDQTGRKFSEHFSKFIATHEEHETTLTKLHIIHSSYLKLNRRYQEEVLQLQNRYLLQYKALFTKRQKILKPDSHNAPNGKDIPDFWLVAMKNSSIVAGYISAADEEVLKCLRDVRVEGLGKTQGFKLVFQFDKNTFFSNESLTKTFTYEYEDDYKGEFRNGSAIGCTIEWKDGKNLTTLSDGKRNIERKYPVIMAQTNSFIAFSRG